jgi:hypothetical protein
MDLIHGRWKIDVNNKVLMQWFADSWNEEAIITYVKEFRQVAQPLIDSEWAIISIFEEWQLGVPQIEKHVAEHCEWFIKNGCIRDCHIYSSDAIKAMQLEKMIPHTEGNYTRCVFEDLNEGIGWLETQGFNISEPSFLSNLVQK